MVTLQQSSDEFGGSHQSVKAARNIGWVTFCCLDYVSDCGAAYLLRPTELCLGDGIIGGWQFNVQAYVVVVTTTILMFFLAFPFYFEEAWASRPLLWPGLFALTLTGAIADIHEGSERSVQHNTMIYLVLVYVEEIPALVVKCNLLSHDLARGASTQWWVWISLALSLVGVIWRLGSMLVRMCCGDRDGEQGPQVRYPIVVGRSVKVSPHA